MARITAIYPVKRLIRVVRRTTAEVCWDTRYFSITAYDAGAEIGIKRHEEDLQLDFQQARILREYLDQFLQQEEGELT